MVKVKLLAHSINSHGNDISSWELEYNKSIHAEFMTHRVFSRNAGSSRAIPFKVALSSVESNPALPVIWGGHQKGMSPGAPLSGRFLEDVKLWDKKARKKVSDFAQLAHDASGLHKSIVNRWIDPWAHIKVLVTTTQLNNFFQLRCHPAAEPIFQCLAFKMLELYVASTPRRIEDGGWHMPYWESMPLGLTTEEKLKVATARACWVSYNAPDKTDFYIQGAFDRHDSCIDNGHWSPLEHCAQAMSIHWSKAHDDLIDYPWSNFDDPANRFQSYWSQYRKMFPDEHRYQEFDLQYLLQSRPAFTEDPQFVI